MKMTHISEDIIRRASDGDADAFEQVYRAHCRFVYNVAWRVLGSREDAEEATQEVFVAIYRKLGSFSFESSLRTWIYRITVNTALNFAKKRSRYTDRNIPYEDGRHDSAAPNAADEVIEKENREQLVDAMLSALNPDQRACLVLRVMQDLSYEDIARTLNININTVRTRIKRAREKLLVIRSEVISHEMS